MEGLNLGFYCMVQGVSQSVMNDGLLPNGDVPQKSVKAEEEGMRLVHIRGGDVNFRLEMAKESLCMLVPEVTTGGGLVFPAIKGIDEAEGATPNLVVAVTINSAGIATGLKRPIVKANEGLLVYEIGRRGRGLLFRNFFSD